MCLGLFMVYSKKIVQIFAAEKVLEVRGSWLDRILTLCILPDFPSSRCYIETISFFLVLASHPWCDLRPREDQVIKSDKGLYPLGATGPKGGTPIICVKTFPQPERRNISGNVRNRTLDSTPTYVCFINDRFQPKATFLNQSPLRLAQFLISCTRTLRVGQ